MAAPRIYIGYDPSEKLAYEVCRVSLQQNGPVDISPVSLPVLRRAGLYRRGFFLSNEQPHDTQDGRPFSTEFSFSRFLVPILGQIEGRHWVLWSDSDFLFRADVRELFALADDRYACMVVKHDYRPLESHKMRRALAQERYSRKNWSSLILWNCHHPATQSLTPYEVNTSPGRWLHGFSWIEDRYIGEIPGEWNWLQSWSDPEVDAKAVHYTLATPDVPHAPETPWDAEWREIAERIAE